MSDKPAIHLNMEDETQVKAFTWAMNLAKMSEMTNEFLADFWNKLVFYGDVYEEFAYYMNHNEFLCKAQIEGYTLADIMVYQMDHFKAALDKPGMEKYKCNGDFMLLMAFDTFLKMKDDPEKIIYDMKHDTGTDYPDKDFNIV